MNLANINGLSTRVSEIEIIRRAVTDAVARETVDGSSAPNEARVKTMVQAILTARRHVDAEFDRMLGLGVVLDVSEVRAAQSDTPEVKVRLAKQPSATVTVAVAKFNAGVSLSSSSLSFTTANWSTEQTVTLTIGASAAGSDNVTFTASGGGYDNIFAVLPVYVA